MNGSVSGASGVECIWNTRLIDEALDCPGAVVLKNGKILAVLQGNFSRETAVCTAAAAAGVPVDSVTVTDACGLVLQPAFVDMHAHFRYPGQTQKEDLDSGLSAAAAGGFGTVVLMPNTSPVVSSAPDALRICREAAERGIADVYQTVSLTRNFDGTDTTHLDSLAVYAAGMSGTAGAVPVVTEDGRDVASAAVMLEAMEKCAQKNIIVSCHSEDSSLAAAARPYRQKALELLAQGTAAGKLQAYEALEAANRLLSLAEDTATARNLELARAAGCAVHIAHVSTSGSMEYIRRAKDAGQRVTCEVTPHHLGLSVATGDPALRHLVNPPLRSERDRAAVVAALADGTADVIATDHAPHTVADKAGGAPGFSGLETAYALCNTVLVREGVLDARQLSALMSARPARILGLDTGEFPRGRLLPGYAADLVLCNPDEAWLVQGDLFRSKGKYTPLEGKNLYGRVCRVYHRGIPVFKQ